MGMYDPSGDALEPAALARVCIRQRFRFMAVLMTVTSAIGAYLLCGRMLTSPTLPLVAGISAGCAVLFGAPLLLLSLLPPPPLLLEHWTVRIELNRRAGKPARAFSTTFLALVFAGGVAFAVTIAIWMPLPKV